MLFSCMCGLPPGSLVSSQTVSLNGDRKQCEGWQSLYSTVENGSAILMNKINKNLLGYTYPQLKGGGDTTCQPWPKVWSKGGADLNP